MFRPFLARTEYRRVYEANEAWLLDIAKRRIEQEWGDSLPDPVLYQAIRLVRADSLEEAFAASWWLDEEWTAAGLGRRTGKSGTQKGLVETVKDVLEAHGFGDVG